MILWKWPNAKKDVTYLYIKKNSVTVACFNSHFLVLYICCTLIKYPDVRTGRHSGLVYQKRRAMSEWNWEKGERRGLVVLQHPVPVWVQRRGLWMQGLCMLAALCECVTAAGGVKTQLSHRGDRSYGDECTSRSVDCFASLLYTYDLPTDAPAHSHKYTRLPTHTLSIPLTFSQGLTCSAGSMHLRFTVEENMQLSQW